MALTLYFLRHGQTTLSRDDTFCGSGLDPELTPDGLSMARAFADAYRTTSWRAIYCSALKRTIATAKPFCDGLGMDLQIRPELNEIAYGKWEGLTKSKVDQQYHDDYIRWLADPAWHAPTGGELAVAIARRGMQVIEEIKARFDDGNVLIVSHKATIRIMLCWPALVLNGATLRSTNERRFSRNNLSFMSSGVRYIGPGNITRLVQNQNPIRKSGISSETLDN